MTCDSLLFFVLLACFCFVNTRKANLRSYEKLHNFDGTVRWAQGYLTSLVFEGTWFEAPIVEHLY
jgi:hypothetical protein